VRGDRARHLITLRDRSDDDLRGIVDHGAFLAPEGAGEASRTLTGAVVGTCFTKMFSPFRVDAELLDRTDKAAFMHDLPGHRGEEVTAEVLDGTPSIASTQAQNKNLSAMAILEWCHGVG
jgi:aspartate carbamoyltransferase catalytic subunit